MSRRRVAQALVWPEPPSPKVKSFGICQNHRMTGFVQQSTKVYRRRAPRTCHEYLSHDFTTKVHAIKYGYSGASGGEKM